MVWHKKKIGNIAFVFFEIFIVFISHLWNKKPEGKIAQNSFIGKVKRYILSLRIGTV